MINRSNPLRWARARDSALAILAWLAIAYVVFLALGHVVVPLLLLVFGALLAYVLTPAIAFLSRWIPRWAAVSLVYLLALALLGSLGYAIVSTAVVQLAALSHALPNLLKRDTPQNPAPLFHLLRGLGVTDAQVNAVRDQIIAWAQGAAGTIATQAVPILTGVAGVLVDLVVTLVISIYLVLDGPRLLVWLRTQTPLRQRQRVIFMLELLHRNVGSYVRGEILLATVIGLLVGVGMFFFGLPYALLLGVLALVLEFIPILGVFISGATCVLIALSRGWLIALFVLAYFVGVHVIEGDVLGPRIIGRALGLHPVVAIVAVIAGADLFGFWGAVFAAPLAGVVQAILVAIWTEWRETHPEEFPIISPPVTPPPTRPDESAQPEEATGVSSGHTP